MWALVLASVFVGVGAIGRGAVGAPWPWLVYNVALAWAPVAIGAAAARSRWTLAALGPVWLLFLPNAPYLLTDLIHLPARGPVPRWFDAALLGGAGALGLALGASSVQHVVGSTGRAFGPRIALLVRVAAPVACGFGMWLGRELRLDSWDVVLAPFAVLAGTAATFGAGGPEPWAYALTFGGVFLAASEVAASATSDGPRDREARVRDCAP